MKKRILLVNEASYLSTGFSVYGWEVLNRLYASEKYELAEFGIYAEDDDARWRSIPWKFFPNQPSNPTEIQAFNAHPGNQFGEWRFEKACLEFKPHIVWDIRDWWMAITDRDTVIHTINGIKKICDINLSDMVLTHTGSYKPITKLFNKKYSGKVFKYHVSNYDIPIELTPLHPVLAIKRKKCVLPNFRMSKLEWINSEEISKGDIVCVPISNHISDNSIKNSKLCRLLGYYAAEGCVMYNGKAGESTLKGIQFTFHKEEQEYIMDVVNLIAELFELSSSVKYNNNTAIVRVFSKEIAETISNLIPGKAGDKYLHDTVYHSEIECIRNFLCGLFRGDGYSNQLTKRSSYCTKSKKLAIQVFQLCIRLGILPSCRYNKNTCKGNIFHRYIFGFYAEAHIGFETIVSNMVLLPIPRSNRIDNKYAYLTVKKVEVRHVTDIDVYNFEVEQDNSYVSSFCLHNCEFQERSPFRPFFKWVLMPTVDSAPQDENWIATYLNADAIYAYSEFGLETLDKQGGGLMNLRKTASPGANLSDFHMVSDKQAHKKSLGMPEDTFIVGTVMRNQERKLYPDLIEAFASFLQQAPPELAKKSFLYLHTMYPDVGWHIPRFLKEQGLINKTLFTYICQTCHATFPLFYQDARTHCRHCGKYAATLPGVQVGITREGLGKVLNLFDAYVQYSVCEGFGMPLVEAAACGTPILAIDYSAMSDIIKKLDGVPIKVQRMFREPKTHAKRALPDNQDLVDKLLAIAGWSKEQKMECRRKLRSGVEEHYSWDKTARTWEECFDNIDIVPDNKSWMSPSRITRPNTQAPQNLTNDEFIQWAIMNVAGRPELLNTYVALRLTRDLNWGASQIRGNSLSNDTFMDAQHKWKPYDRNDVVAEMIKACEHKNVWEQQRVGGLRRG